jgi:hypothetical protein
VNAPISLVDEILHDPAASKWLKDALRSALERDPIDVLNDAMRLAALYQAVVTVLFEERDVH